MEKVKRELLDTIEKLVSEIDEIQKDIEEFTETVNLYSNKNCKISNYSNLNVAINGFLTKARNFSHRRDWYHDLKSMIKDCKQKLVFMETIKLIIKNFNKKSESNYYFGKYFNLVGIEDVDIFIQSFLDLINTSTSEQEDLKDAGFAIMMHDYMFKAYNKYINKILSQYISVCMIYKELIDIINDNKLIEKGIINRIKSKDYYIKTSSEELRNILFSLVESYNEKVKNTNCVIKEKPIYEFNVEVNHPSRQERKDEHEKLYTDAEPETLEGKPLEQLNEIYSFLCEILSNKEDYKIIVADLSSLFEYIDESNIDIIIANLIYMLNNNQDLDKERKTTIVKRLGQIKKQ